MREHWARAELAYLAGIIDGEGCIGVYRSGWRYAGRRTPRHALTLKVTNTDPRMLLWIMERFGGTVRPTGEKRPRHRESWVWQMGSARMAANILVAVFPYLVIKREQAVLALGFVATLRRGWQGTPTDEECLVERDKIAVGLKKLKRIA